MKEFRKVIIIVFVLIVIMSINIINVGAEESTFDFYSNVVQQQCAK